MIPCVFFNNTRNLMKRQTNIDMKEINDFYLNLIESNIKVIIETFLNFINKHKVPKAYPFTFLKCL